MENNTLYSPCIFSTKEHGKYTTIGCLDKTLKEFIFDAKRPIIYFYVIDKEHNYIKYPSLKFQKKKRKNKASYTQILSWNEVKNSAILKTQELKVLAILKNASDPLSSRDIEDLSNIRQSSLTRTIHNLKYEGLIFTNYDTSKHSGKLVEHYRLIDQTTWISYSKIPELILKLNQFR